MIAPSIATSRLNAIGYLDREMLTNYEGLKKDTTKGNLLKNHLSNEMVQYLYARSYFKNIPMDEKMTEAMHFY